MKIRVENLAPIKEGVFEEKDLTLIIGDNGTGKTILLETVTFIKDFYNKKIQSFASLKENKPYYDNIKPKFENEILEVIGKVYSLKDEYNDKSEIRVEVNKNELNNLFEEFISKQKQECIRAINERVLSGMDESHFDFKFLNLPTYKDEYEGNIHIYYSQKEFVLLISVFPEFPVESSIIRLDRKKSENIQDILEGMDDEDNYLKIKNGISELIKKTMFKGLYEDYFENGNILYLPSERSMYRRNAFSNIADLMDNHNALTKSSNEMRYSESLFYEEYLRFRANEEERFEMNDLKDIVGWMENDEDKKQLYKLFKGKLEYDEKGEIVSILRNNGLKVPRRLFSTKETKLIPYDMFSDKNTSYKRIIIEEPEANMSLASMNDLVNFFEYHLEDNSKMTLTTHSDVFFSKMNNLLLSNKKFNSVVYELTATPSGSILEEKSIGEYGYEIKLFSDELNNLFEETLKTQDGEFNDND